MRRESRYLASAGSAFFAFLDDAFLLLFFAAFLPVVALLATAVLLLDAFVEALGSAGLAAAAGVVVVVAAEPVTGAAGVAFIAGAAGVGYDGVWA